MSKYIDAELLRKEINRWKKAMADAVGEYSDGVRFALKHFAFVLDSLQQEQDYSDLSDLERAIHRGFLCAGVENVPVAIIKETAKEAMADLERAVIGGDVDNIPKWLKDELNKAFKKGQELSHEDYIRGYTNGYKDAEKQYNESVAYHFPTMPTTPVFGCDGIHCTNPQMDCINCPRRTIGGGFSTSSGTSTATLHGNTSATDGKEHNPSFTD